MSNARDFASRVPVDGALSNRNLIINGGMAIDQRNSGASITVSTSIATYAVDRMSSYHNVPSAVVTAQQSTLGNAKSYKVTTTTAPSGTLTGLQRIHALVYLMEGQDAFFANGQTVTLSFRVETNWTGNLAVRLGNGDWSKSYIVDAAVVSGVNEVAVSVPLEANTVSTNDNTAGLVVEIGTTNEDTLQTSTEGSWLSGDFRCLTTSTQWSKTAGNFINVTELQLEVGDTATPFEHRSYGDELARCQRYFHRENGPRHAQALWTYNGTSASSIFTLPVAMRARPSFSYSGTLEASLSASNSISVYAAGSWRGCSSISSSSSSSSNTRSVRLDAALTTSISNGLSAGLYFNGGAYLDYDAEL